MAEKEKEQNTGGPDPELSGDRHESGEPVPVEKTQENRAGGVGGKNRRSGKKGIDLKTLIRALSERKWIFLLALGFVLVIILLGLDLGSKWRQKPKRESAAFSPEKLSRANLMQETLQPFFIPLPPGAPNVLLRIEPYAVWDSVASVLYRKRELQIRDRLYRNISGLVANQGDLDKKTSLLEDEMMMVVRQFPGMENSEIKIKEAACF